MTAAAPFELRELKPGAHELVLEAPCFQKVQQRVDIVLDVLDPGPVELGVIALQPAAGTIEIVWPGGEGALTIDGAPAEPGRARVCPGEHEVALTFAGRRAYRERVEVRHDETVRVEPRPRPGLALHGELAELGGRDWNRFLVDEAAGRAVLEKLERVLLEGRRAVPAYPEIVRGSASELVREARLLAPGADLFAAWSHALGGVRRARVLVLFDLRHGLIEATGWTLPTDELETLLAPPAAVRVPFMGLDVVGRAGAAPIIAAVHPAGPAQSLKPGSVLLAAGGESIANVSDWERALAAATPGEELTLRVSSGGEERDVALSVAGSVLPTSPASVGRGLLLPRLAHALASREMGRGSSRLSGSVDAGMILVALGRGEQAARILDGADIEAGEDPAGDARATVWYVLESLMRDLAESAYADELAARRSALTGARFGGRSGPPLSAADARD